MPDRPVLTNIASLRAKARQHPQMGAVTQAYRADREAVLRLLNEALATELVCVLRYKRHAFAATGIHSRSIVAEFFEHAVEEGRHADRIAGRIIQLGGLPNFAPEGMASRSHTEYIEGDGVPDMLQEDLVSERVAVESYTEMIRFVGPDDPTTRRMLEEILAEEEQHADDLKSLLDGLRH